jgi:phospholipid N-methyltransferase
VATVFPTSYALASRLLDGIDWAHGPRIVELGPGSGAITGLIAERLIARDAYTGLEISAELTTVLRERFPDLRVVCRSATELSGVVRGGTVDHVVATLPWSVLTVDAQATILADVARALRPGGTFRTYVCVNALLSRGGRMFLDRLRATFPGMRSRLELRNAPPALACVATRR